MIMQNYSGLLVYSPIFLHIGFLHNFVFVSMQEPILQSLFLVCIPFPQVTLHLDHLAHGP